MPITYRSVKGAPLTAEEVDDNFKDLDTRVKSLEDSPPDAEGIASVSVENGQMILQGTHGNTFGPFELPKIFWKPRGPWQPTTLYAPLDLVVHQKSLFSCLAGHTSGDTFPPGMLWQEVFSFEAFSSSPTSTTDDAPLVSVNNSHVVIATPCEKDHLPKNPVLGQLVLVLGTPQKSEICYFNGSSWINIRTQEGL